MKNLTKIVDFLQKNGIFFTKNESLSNHTSIKIGGKAKIFAEPKSKKQLVLCLKYLYCLNEKYIILGNGTNTLFCDEEIDCVVISTKKIRYKKCNKNFVFAGCGLSLFSLLKFCAKKSLSGLESLYGIPGTVGGATVMNAGAYNRFFGDRIEWVDVFVNGKVKRYLKQEMQFSYRSSMEQKKDMVILGVKLLLESGNCVEIQNLQESYFKKRLENQPYKDLSFGSAFKRNLSFEPVSKLIDELGLKGYTIGGAQISKKHAGFIINIGSATCQDCLKLIQYIQEKIFDAYGFVPEPEVKIMGAKDVNIRGLSHTYDI